MLWGEETWYLNNRWIVDAGDALPALIGSPVIRFNETFLLFFLLQREIFFANVWSLQLIYAITVEKRTQWQIPTRPRTNGACVCRSKRECCSATSLTKRPRQQEEANKRRTERTIQLLPALCWCYHKKLFVLGTGGRSVIYLKRDSVFFICHRSVVLSALVALGEKSSNRSSVHLVTTTAMFAECRLWKSNDYKISRVLDSIRYIFGLWIC